MLIRFITSNFLSFRDEIEFSMVPGKAHKHNHHVIKNGSRTGIDGLKSAVIYGANAAGKSNLVAAMEFAKDLIVDGTKPLRAIQRKPFRLSKEHSELPTKFEFEMIVGKKAYNYGFEYNSQHVISEWLYQISKSANKMLFERSTDENNVVTVQPGLPNLRGQAASQFGFVAKGTRENQLFLTESVDRNLPYFKDIYSWFDEQLVFIFPHSRFSIESQLDKDLSFGEALAQFLREFDTGIFSINLQQIDESDVKVPKEIFDRIGENLKPGKGVVISMNGRYLVKKDDNGQLEYSKLVFRHQMNRSDELTTFEVADESDGTQRLIDLLPVMIDQRDSGRVFFIDEIDRSLHPLASYRLLEMFLNQNSTSESSQLIVTTHESSLLDLDLLRRDEIWFVEKNRESSSHVYSLEEFAPRYDRDIRKGYLMGRFGAIPIVNSSAVASWSDDVA